MAVHSVNIHKFLVKFNEEYDFLYNNYDNVAGYEEAIAAGDIFIKQHPDFVREFVEYRQDFISSDREVAAFMFALESMGAL